MLITAVERTCQENVFYDTNPQICECLLLLLGQPVTAPNIQQVASALKDKTVTEGALGVADGQGVSHGAYCTGDRKLKRGVGPIRADLPLPRKGLHRTS